MTAPGRENPDGETAKCMDAAQFPRAHRPHSWMPAQGRGGPFACPGYGTPADWDAADAARERKFTELSERIRAIPDDDPAAPVPATTGDVEGLDLTPFIDAMARAMYLDLDSHASFLSWEDYRDDERDGDPSAAKALYIGPMTRYVLRALPKFPRQDLAKVRADAASAALVEAADEMGRHSRDDRNASHWRAHAWGNWLRTRAGRVET